VDDGNVGAVAAEEVAGLYAWNVVGAEAGMEVMAPEVGENEGDYDKHDDPGDSGVGWQEGGEEGGGGGDVHGAWRRPQRWLLLVSVWGGARGALAQAAEGWVSRPWCTGAGRRRIGELGGCGR